MSMDLLPHQEANYDRLVKFPREVLAKYIVFSAAFGIQFDALEAFNDKKKIEDLKSLLAERDRMFYRISPERRARIRDRQFKRGDVAFVTRAIRIDKRIKTLERWLKRTYAGGKPCES